MNSNNGIKVISNPWSFKGLGLSFSCGVPKQDASKVLPKAFKNAGARGPGEGSARAEQRSQNGQRCGALGMKLFENLLSVQYCQLLDAYAR